MTSIPIGALFLVTFTLGWFLTTPLMAVAMVAYECMVFGITFRATRKIHVAFMNSAIFLDLSIVLILQIKRHAVQTAVGMDLSTYQQMHILMSSIATCLYFPQLILGWMLFNGKLRALLFQKIHRQLGYAIFTFRTLGLILMFSMLK